jgi:sphingomyelin phosphodiesterase D
MLAIVGPVAAPGAQFATWQDSSLRPFYAIAHRVLTIQGVRDALRNGANAIEIDMTSWRSGWWADHDGLPTSRGATAEKMFQTVAEERKAGQNVIFVWLDLKNPDYEPDPNQKTSIEGLRKLARDILQPAGVKVLYGFYKAGIGKRAYQSIRQDLNANEALDVDGEVAMAEKELRDLPRGMRVYSNGFFDLAWMFEGPFTNLKRASKSGAFGKVYGWTLANHNDKTKVDRLVNGAQVDGLIYGFKHTHYYDHADTRGAYNDIARTIQTGSRYRMATTDDNPWSV